MLSDEVLLLVLLLFFFFFAKKKAKGRSNKREAKDLPVQREKKIMENT